MITMTVETLLRVDVSNNLVMPLHNLKTDFAISQKLHTYSSYFISGEGYVNGRANSAHSILLSHNLTESGVYYLCNVREVEDGKMKAMDKNVTTQVTNVTGLLPDTTYRVDCVAYNSTGVEVCLEVNTTVTTRELHSVTL